MTNEDLEAITGIDQDEARAIELKEETRRRIAAAFEVPDELLGDG